MDDPGASRQLAEELRQARARIAMLEAGQPAHTLASVAETMVDGFALLDVNGVHVAVNPALCRMTGFSRDELVGTGMPHAYWPPERAEEYAQGIARARDGEMQSREIEFLRKDGSRFPVLLAPSVLRNDKGDVVAVVATVTDIGELAAYRERLAESEQLFRLTFDQAPVGAVLFGGERFERVNDAMCAMLGYARDELLALSFLDITHPDDREASALAARRLATGEADAIRLEKRYLRKDGETVWALTEVRVVRDAAGAVIAQLALIEDVTERRRALEDLRDSESRLRTVLDAADEGIILQAADGTVLTFNQAAADLLGVEESEVVGESALGRDWHTIHPDGSPWPPEDHPTMRALKTGEPARGLVIGIVRDGETRWMSANAHPVAAGDADAPAFAVVSLADVTEQHEARRALEESEERYRLLLQNISDAVYVHELAGEGVGRFIEVNDRACEMLGYSREEFLAMDVGRVDTAEQQARTPRIVRELLRTGRSLFETEHVARDGRRIPVEVSTRAFELQGRTVILSVVRDITERVAAAAALAETQRILDETQEISRLGGWEYDVASGRFTWTKELYRLHGVDDDFDVNDLRRNIGFYAPEDQAVIDAAFTGILETGAPYDLELRFLPAGADRPIWVRTTARAELQDGRVVRVIGNLADVDERKRTDEALRETEERYRSLFEQSPVSVWEEDFSAVRDWLDEQGDVADWGAYFDAHPEHAVHCAGLVRIVASNRAGLDFFGVETTGDLETDLNRYFTEESFAGFREELAALAAGATRFAAEIPIADLDGNRRRLDLRLSVVPGHEARLDRVLVCFIDVTEQRAAEAEIRRLNEELQRRVVSRTEQLDAATRELEALAYSIAHDVRAPLRTIDGFSAAVLEDESGVLSDESVSSLRRVRAAAQTLARLLDDLTGLSRASRRELARQTVDLSALAEDVGREIALEHETRTVQLAVAPGLNAEADPVLARIILRELIGNAWKFTAGNDEAHVEVGALDVDGERAFFVRDDGAGFDMRFAEHLFGVFQRMHPPGEFPGDGIGLAMVQRLVRRHGGRCWASAEPGAGATLFFTLPGEARDS